MCTDEIPNSNNAPDDEQYNFLNSKETETAIRILKGYS